MNVSSFLNIGTGDEKSQPLGSGRPAYIGIVTAATSVNPFRVFLRHRNFRVFLTGQTLSLIGTWMQSMAAGWLALDLTNSAFMVGLVASASSIPILVFTMPAGVMVDRSDKMKLVRIAQFAFLVNAIMLWWLTYTHLITIVSLIGLAFMSGLISAVEIPARQSMFIDLVGREDLSDAIALNSSGFNLARVVGPGVAAVVIARLGIAWCFFLNAASFVTVLIGLFMIQLPKWVARDTEASPWEEVREALHYMRDTPKVRALMYMVTVYSVLGVPVLALMPVVAREMFGLGASGYGLLMSYMGIGGLAGALVLHGLFIATSFATMNEVVASTVEARQGEAFAWLSAAIISGISLGTATAGVAVHALEPRAGFALVAVVTAGAVALAIAIPPTGREHAVPS